MSKKNNTKKEDTMKKTHIILLGAAGVLVVVGFLIFGRGAGDNSSGLSAKELVEDAAILEQGVPEAGGHELAVVEAVDAKRQ